MRGMEVRALATLTAGELVPACLRGLREFPFFFPPNLSFVPSMTVTRTVSLATPALAVRIAVPFLPAKARPSF